MQLKRTLKLEGRRTNERVTTRINVKLSSILLRLLLFSTRSTSFFTQSDDL